VCVSLLEFNQRVKRDIKCSIWAAQVSPGAEHIKRNINSSTNSCTMMKLLREASNVCGEQEMEPQTVRCQMAVNKPAFMDHDSNL